MSYIIYCLNDFFAPLMSFNISQCGEVAGHSDYKLKEHRGLKINLTLNIDINVIEMNYIIKIRTETYRKNKQNTLAARKIHRVRESI